MPQPLLATGSAHVASTRLTKSGTSLDTDWPHWQMSVVHRVIGGPVRRARNAHGVEELVENLEDEASQQRVLNWPSAQESTLRQTSEPQP
jgi:hypothetical protein